MPVYEIVYTREAARTLRLAPADVRAQIQRQIREYAADPTGSRNVIKLEGRPSYRLRAGEWRVIFEIDKESKGILVLKVGPRGDIYK